MLAKSDSPDNYKEVTEAEKSTIAAADAKWQEPPQQFIDQWDMIASTPHKLGSYNPKTGFFELNGLTDLTYKDAIHIYQSRFAVTESEMWRNVALRLRTNLLPWYRLVNKPILLYASSVDYLRLAPDKGDCYCIPAANEENKMPDSIKILGRFDQSSRMDFSRCTRLQSFLMHFVRFDMDLSRSPAIDSASFRYMIDNASNSGPIQIKVHNDIFDKMSDAENQEWNNLLLDAQNKQISFITVS